jgi:glycosyltransferase involved in cell wall biosynthesis
MMNTAIEIIIPTTATLARKASLLEAIDAVHCQQSVSATAIVVVNGSVYDQELYTQLQNRSDIRFHYESVGSLPNALRVGRTLVRAEYFGFLDDDDLLLEGALAARLAEMAEADVVVGNGYIDSEGEQRLLRTSFRRCAGKPFGKLLSELLRLNWLASCGGLYRTRSIGVEFFTELPKYFEWTYVGFNLVYQQKRIRFVSRPTFHVRDSSTSLSKEAGNPEALVDFLKMLRNKPMHRSLRKALTVKLGSAYHSLSEQALCSGSLATAMILHLKSLNCRENLKYLSYSARLLRTLFSRRQTLQG